MIPFVYTLAKLAELHPVSGGIYTYSKEQINRHAGFVSGWSYFVGKTVSAAFLAHAFTHFFQQQISFLHNYPTVFLTCIVIFALIFLNIAGTQIGGKIQIIFFSIKVIPILFTLLFGLLTFKPNLFLETPQIFPILSSIPLAIYAFMGFEITCSIGHMIKRGRENIFKVILLSFLIVTITYFLFQSILYGATGTRMIHTLQQPFTLLANNFFISQPLVGRAITALVYTSVIAGSFGILTSNCWNLHALARDKHFPGTTWLTKISNNHIPWVSLIFEGAIACLMLLISKNQIALQSMSVFGVLIAFLFSSIAALYAIKKNQHFSLPKIMPILAIAGCTYILFLCLQKIFVAGVSLPFIAILLGGMIISFAKK